MKHLVCTDCDTRGPGAGSSEEARSSAQQTGWLVGKRGAVTYLPSYCPDCKGPHIPPACVENERGTPCDMAGRYQVTWTSDRTQTKNVCAKHLAKFIRDLAVSADDMITLQYTAP